MSDKDFDDFLRKLSEEQREQEKVDWISVKQSWLADLAVLYGRVREFLQPHIERRLVRLSLGTTFLIEQHFGEYEVPYATIYLAERLVEIVPRGRFIIGALGRVDIKGPQGEVRLVLVGSEDAQPRPHMEEHTWKIVTAKRQLQDLTKDRFYDALMFVANA